MGSAGCSILRFSSLGHQSRFDLTPLAVCVNGHFASVDICFLLWSVGRLHHLRGAILLPPKRLVKEHADSLVVTPPRGGGGPTSSGTDLAHPMDRQVVRRDNVAALRERGQEMIVLAGLGVVPG